MKEYDVLVIGGGPAGMTACLYLLRAGHNLAWAEMLAPGGQVLLTAEVENYPGFPQGVKGYELCDLMAKQLEGYTYDRYTEEVKEIRPGNDGNNQILLGEEWIRSKTVVICSGAEYKKLGLPKEESLVGRGISYCGLCDGNFFQDQVIACVGGGNTALEEALYLAGLARKVYLIHRRDRFRGDKIYQDKVMSHERIEILYNFKPSQILGEEEVKGLELENTKSGEHLTLEVDGIFIFVGLAPRVSFLPQSIEQDQYGFILTDTEMRTNLPGIFAAGDIRSKRCRQIATAVGDGAAAAYSVHLYLDEL